MTKTLLALGGSRFLEPVIESAHSIGHRVVTSDYLPDNPAHKLADGYRNVSITDKIAVLRVARELEIDGIVSFATDPGVPAAAYVAETLGLPFQCSYETAHLLQTKDLFRNFLQLHGFNSPSARTVSSAAEAATIADSITYPVIVKPVDAAGSKGVTKVDVPHALANAVSDALAFSAQNKCIIEDFIEMRGRQISAEAFTIDGKFQAIAFMDQLFDEEGPNPWAPRGNVYPSQHAPAALAQLEADLDRLSSELGLRTGIYNIEARIGTNGAAYIMEVTPRGGGNRLAEFIRAATGTDLIRASVQAAVGDPLDTPLDLKSDGIWLQEVLISRESGIFDRLDINPALREHSLRELKCWKTPGDAVDAFNHASYAFGSVLLRFDTPSQLTQYLDGDARIRTILAASPTGRY